jgi:hypothetical protein
MPLAAQRLADQALSDPVVFTQSAHTITGGNNQPREESALALSFAPPKSGMRQPVGSAPLAVGAFLWIMTWSSWMTFERQHGFFIMTVITLLAIIRHLWVPIYGLPDWPGLEPAGLERAKLVAYGVVSGWNLKRPDDQWIEIVDDPSAEIFAYDAETRRLHVNWDSIKDFSTQKIHDLLVYHERIHTIPALQLSVRASRWRRWVNEIPAILWYALNAPWLAIRTVFKSRRLQVSRNRIVPISHTVAEDHLTPRMLWRQLEQQGDPIEHVQMSQGRIPAMDREIGALFGAATFVRAPRRLERAPSRWRPSVLISVFYVLAFGVAFILGTPALFFVSVAFILTVTVVRVASWIATPWRRGGMMDRVAGRGEAIFMATDRQNHLFEFADELFGIRGWSGWLGARRGDPAFPSSIGGMTMIYPGRMQGVGTLPAQFGDKSLRTVRLQAEANGLASPYGGFVMGSIVDEKGTIVAGKLWIPEHLDTAPRHTLKYRRWPWSRSYRSTTWIAIGVDREGGRIYYVQAETGLCTSACINSSRVSRERREHLARSIAEDYRVHVPRYGRDLALYRALLALDDMDPGLRQEVARHVIANLADVLMTDESTELLEPHPVTAQKLMTVYQRLLNTPSLDPELVALGEIRQRLAWLRPDQRQSVQYAFRAELEHAGRATARAREALARNFGLGAELDSPYELLSGYATRQDVAELLLNTVTDMIPGHEDFNYAHRWALQYLSLRWSDHAQPEFNRLARRVLRPALSLLGKPSAIAIDIGVKERWLPALRDLAAELWRDRDPLLIARIPLVRRWSKTLQTAV